MRKVSVAVRGGAMLAAVALATEDVAERTVGWLGKNEAHPGEGLLISPCAAVHTLGMRISIDVVFLDREFKICKVRPGLKPGRFAFGTLMNLALPWRSQVLELPLGASAGLKAGDVLDVTERA